MMSNQSNAAKSFDILISLRESYIIILMTQQIYFQIQFLYNSAKSFCLFGLLIILYFYTEKKIS